MYPLNPLIYHNAQHQNCDFEEVFLISRRIYLPQNEKPQVQKLACFLWHFSYDLVWKITYYIIELHGPCSIAQKPSRKLLDMTWNIETTHLLHPYTAHQLKYANYARLTKEMVKTQLQNVSHFSSAKLQHSLVYS